MGQRSGTKRSQRAATRDLLGDSLDGLDVLGGDRVHDVVVGIDKLRVPAVFDEHLCFNGVRVDAVHGCVIDLVLGHSPRTSLLEFSSPYDVERYCTAGAAQGVVRGSGGVDDLAVQA